MPKISVRPSKLSELSWLLDVRETPNTLTEISPIFVRKEVVHCSQVYSPERHLHCEFGIRLTGKGLIVMENEQAEVKPGDIFLSEPGVPHWGRDIEYPSSGIVVYFLPSVLIEMAP